MMKITKSQLKQIIKEEISKIINEAYTDDMQKPIRPGDFLQLVYNRDIEETLIHNFGQTKPTGYEMEHGGQSQDVEARMIVQVLNPQPRQEEITETFADADPDYLDKLQYKKDHGVPNPEVAASNARIAAAKEKQKKIDKLYLDTLKNNPEAERLFDAIQDYGYENDYDLSGAEGMLQQFLDLFPDGPDEKDPDAVRKRAKNSVTYFH